MAPQTVTMEALLRQIVGAFAVATILLSTNVSAMPQMTVTPSAIMSFSNSTKPTGASVSSSISSALSEAGVKRPSSTVTSKASLVETSRIYSHHARPTWPVGGPNAHFYHGPAYLPHGAHNLQPACPQNETNGNSEWGLPGRPSIPHFINSPGTPMQGGFPWGNRRANDTNYYSTASIPNTGVTRTYDLTVSSATIKPDGVVKPGIVVNGGFPGPLIEANWGDWMLINVHNDDLDEGTALHWHGLLQQGTPYYDGVPAVGMCPIAPGNSFQYMVRADLYGTSWYHSHYSAQYAGGALGPMIIHGPLQDDISYDVDVGPVMLSDWYHSSYFKLVEQTMAPARENLGPPLSNNILINGKNNYPCANTTLECTPNAGISRFNFTSGKKHRLRIINTSAEAVLKFSIDGHNMTIFENDFVPIVPYTTNVVTVGVGQRSDVIVEANGSPSGAYWMRANSTCSAVDGISPFAVAAIYYEDADTTSIPDSSPSYTDAQLAACKNDDLDLTVPYYPIAADPNPGETQVLEITYATNGSTNGTGDETAYNLWYINNQTFRADYNDPVLLEANLGVTEFDPDWNVYSFNTSSVRIIIKNTFTGGPHPMHLHGHNMQILASGVGEWDGSITNQNNPQRRDVHILEAAADENTPGYMVLQYEQDNPGVWPLHCHIAWHVSAGLYINVLEMPEKIASMNLPGVVGQTCRDWSNWCGSELVPQIDSGL